MIDAAWNTLCLLAPWLILGAVLAGFLHVLLPGDWLRRRLSGPAGVWQAVLLGVPLPLCSCGVIPAAVGLRKSGASDQAAIGFLISTPQTGVDSILVSGSFLGWPFALFKVAVAVITGVVGGLLAEDTRTPGERGQTGPDVLAGSGQRRSLWQWFPHGIEVIRSIWPWLVAGVLVSAALETWIVPTRFFQSLTHWGPMVSMLMMLLISIPLYVCATASVPIAATLVAGGMPPGAALVFLLAGPATNVATIGAVYARFGRRNLVVYLATLIVGSMLGGLVFDGVIGPAGENPVPHIHEHMSWFSRVCGALLLGLFAWFTWQNLQRWNRRRRSRAGTGPHETLLTLQVSGMNCQSCVTKISDALDRVPGVKYARVDLESGQVVVAGAADTDTVRTSIRSAGFQPGNVVETDG